MAIETKGTLTPGARQVLEVLVLVLVIAYGAIEGYRLVVSPAQAAQPAAAAQPSDSINQKLDQALTAIGDVQKTQQEQGKSIAIILRQLGLDGLGPPPLRTSGVGR